MNKSELILLFVLAIFFSACKNDDETYTSPSLPDISNREKAGGATTVYSVNSKAYSVPAPNLTTSQLNQHDEGDQVFEAKFIAAPAPNYDYGLGPIFNNASCIACHPSDGRAPFPKNIIARSGFFLRVSMPGVNPSTGGVIPVPGFGTQVQNQALYGYQPEAQFAVSYTPITETLADGTKITLQKPTYRMENTYIPLPSGVLISPRIGTPVFGLGLLEAVPESSIIAAADPNDLDNDEISGKVNWVWDATSNTKRIGRFGWKANTATILEQCAGAFVNDMGITNYLFNEETGKGQSNGSDGLADDPELSRKDLNDVTFYCQTLAVPAARNLNKLSVRNGARIFEEISCSKCHTPQQKTGNSPIKALANQTFYPYTDMLLHDMGDDLADGRPDFLANGNEWRTRPLWGIGLQNIVNGHTEYLHDGRAKNITEAILWHGGEAKKSKEKFKKLSKNDRNDLLEFLNSF